MKYCKWSLLAIVMLMMGCSTPYNAVTKTAKVLWDPDIPVGYPEELPSKVALTMLAEPDVNPNESLAPTPIAYQIIELRDSSLLMAGDFDQLLNDLEKSFNNLTDSLQRFMESFDDFFCLQKCDNFALVARHLIRYTDFPD